jgi:hypothetical protein
MAGMWWQLLRLPRGAAQQPSSSSAGPTPASAPQQRSYRASAAPHPPHFGGQLHHPAPVAMADSGRARSRSSAVAGAPPSAAEGGAFCTREQVSAIVQAAFAEFAASAGSAAGRSGAPQGRPVQPEQPETPPLSASPAVPGGVGGVMLRGAGSASAVPEGDALGGGGSSRVGTLGRVPRNIVRGASLRACRMRLAALAPSPVVPGGF